MYYTPEGYYRAYQRNPQPVTGIKRLTAALRFMIGHSAVDIPDADDAHSMAREVHAIIDDGGAPQIGAYRDADGIVQCYIRRNPAESDLYARLPGRAYDMVLPTIGMSIRAWRESLHLTVDDAARMSGTSVSTVRKTEQGYYSTAYAVWTILNGYPVEDIRKIIWNIDKKERVENGR